MVYYITNSKLPSHYYFYILGLQPCHVSGMVCVCVPVSFCLAMCLGTGASASGGRRTLGMSEPSGAPSSLSRLSAPNSAAAAAPSQPTTTPVSASTVSCTTQHKCHYSVSIYIKILFSSHNLSELDIHCWAKKRILFVVIIICSFLCSSIFKPNNL